jgi:chromate transporter
MVADSVDQQAPLPPTSKPPSLLELAVAFVLKGNFTYGGGSATITTLHHDIVERRQWLTEEPFQLSYALSRLTPGTNLLAFSACVGYLLRRIPGALVALLAGSLPCGGMALALTALYASWSHYAVVQVATRGALGAAVAVTVMTGVTLIRPHWRSAGRAKLLVFVGGGFVTAQFLRLSPLLVLLLAAVGGLIWPVRSPS